MGTAPERVASMGIDVAVTRGLDVVALDDSLRVAFGPTTLHRADLADLIRRTEPHVIAIDSPPAWGSSGKSRPVERQLQALGISIFPTPAAEFARSLHHWMKTGFDVFKVAGDLGYPLYTGGASSARSAIEVLTEQEFQAEKTKILSLPSSSRWPRPRSAWKRRQPT